MAKEWQKVHCMEKLPETDTESSPTTVYKRRNFKQITMENAMDGDPVQMWEFEQQEISREEWDQLTSLNTQQTMQTLNDLKADIAFLSL